MTLGAFIGVEPADALCNIPPDVECWANELGVGEAYTTVEATLNDVVLVSEVIAGVPDSIRFGGYANETPYLGPTPENTTPCATEGINDAWDIAESTWQQVPVAEVRDVVWSNVLEPVRRATSGSRSADSSCSWGEYEGRSWYFYWKMTVRNANGNELRSFAQEYAWYGTGSGGTMTYLNTACYGFSGIYSYRPPCSVDHTAPHNTARVFGSWDFYFCCNKDGYGIPKEPHAEAVLRADSYVEVTAWPG